MDDKYITLDDDIISQLSAFPNLVEDGEVSKKVLDSIEYILDANYFIKDKSPINTFKGLFVKKTCHYAGVGFRTEIGLIYQDYYSSDGETHYVDYIIVDEETNQYIGNADNYGLNPYGQWTLSADIGNLGYLG